MRKRESIQDYFTRVSQFKEKLSGIGETLNEGELVMTALNGLTRPWDSFIQTLCAKKESMNFDVVWEDCIQEARVANREALLKEDDQALANHTKRRRQSNSKKDSHKEYRPPKKFKAKEKTIKRKITPNINVIIVIR